MLEDISMCAIKIVGGIFLLNTFSDTGKITLCKLN